MIFASILVDLAEFQMLIFQRYNGSVFMVQQMNGFSIIVNLGVCVMQDPKRTGHRGFGFVTFAEDGIADRVSRRSHEICGQQVLMGELTVFGFRIW